MNLTSRFPFLATLAACSIFFAVPAYAQDELVTLVFRGRDIQVPRYLVQRYLAQGAKVPEREVGYVKIAGSGTVLINGIPQRNGAKLRCGDTIETTENVEAHFTNGPAYIIDAGTRLRLTCRNNGPVQFLVTVGGIHPLDKVEDVLEQIPYNAALGVGNNTFPSLGGGSTTGAGRYALRDANGNITGYVIVDENGNVVGFTDSSGVLRGTITQSPNGPGVS